MGGINGNWHFGLTTEDIEDKSGCLATASLVSPCKFDDIPGLGQVIVVLLEVLEDLACPLVQRQGIWVRRAWDLKRLPHFLRLGRSFDLGPKPCDCRFHR